MVFLVLIIMIVAQPVFAQTSGAVIRPVQMPLPGGSEGIGFDDLVYAKELDKILVPAGHTGKLYMIDPSTSSMTSIDEFSSSPGFQKGHHTGVSSADEGDGYIFTADHGTRQLEAINVQTGKIAARSPLANDPDIIRYAGVTHEVWVTEPDGKGKKGMEVFSFTPDKPALKYAFFVATADGPESLTIDAARQKAYTNVGPQTAAIDLHSHAVTAQWPNGCEKSRGTAIDEARNFLFVACKEGKAVSFDLNQGPRQVGSVVTGPGADLVAFNPRLSHFYITGAMNASLSIVGVSSKGGLSLLGLGRTAVRSHCVAADSHDHIWVCDPIHGGLLRYNDTFKKVQ